MTYKDIPKRLIVGCQAGTIYMIDNTQERRRKIIKMLTGNIHEIINRRANASEKPNRFWVAVPITKSISRHYNKRRKS